MLKNEMGGWTKAKRIAAAKKAARTRKRNAGNKGVTSTVEKKEKPGKGNVDWSEAGKKSWITRRRNIISTTLFGHKYDKYEELDSKQKRKVAEKLHDEYSSLGDTIVDEHSKEIPGYEKSMLTEKLAYTATKYEINKLAAPRFQIVGFLGKKGRESAGIVDLLAIRKDHNAKKNKSKGMEKADYLQIMQIQVKGGTSQRPSNKDIKRMKKVAKYFNFEQNILAEWKREWSFPKFYCLTKQNKWKLTSPRKIFGKS